MIYVILNSDNQIYDATIYIDIATSYKLSGFNVKVVHLDSSIFDYPNL